jgi:hypothetical protein
LANLPASTAPTRDAFEPELAGAPSLDFHGKKRAVAASYWHPTDWQRAGITGATAQQMTIRGLIDRRAAGSFVLPDQRRAVLEALMMRVATRGR